MVLNCWSRSFMQGAAWVKELWYTCFDISQSTPEVKASLAKSKIMINIESVCWAVRIVVLRDCFWTRFRIQNYRRRYQSWWGKKLVGTNSTWLHYIIIKLTLFAWTRNCIRHLPPGIRILNLHEIEIVFGWDTFGFKLLHCLIIVSILMHNDNVGFRFGKITIHQ